MRAGGWLGVGNDPETLAPGWLFSRWSATYGEDAARAIAARIVQEPATDLTLRDPADAAGLSLCSETIGTT